MTKPLTSLIPSIESRLSGWQTIQTRLSQMPEIRTRPTITLSRAFGCEGFPLAECLQARLQAATGEGWTLFDKALIERVAKEEGIPLHLLKNLGDASAKLESLGLHRAGRRTHDEAFEKVAETLVVLARQGNAILVGRGGALLCKGMANCFHFRLEGSRTFRIDSVARRLDMGPKEAEAYVIDNERAREDFISDRLGARVSDPQHYHAVFNNELQRVDVIADAILAYVKAAWPEPGLFK